MIEKDFNPTNTNAIRNGISAKATYRRTKFRKYGDPVDTFVRFKSVDDRGDFWYVGVDEADTIDNLKAFGDKWWGYVKIYKPGVDRPQYASDYTRIYNPNNPLENI